MKLKDKIALWPDPCPEEDMHRRGKKRDDTICEVLRQIYKRVHDEEVRLLVRVATTMAKKMGDKLHEYKEQEKKRSQINLCL